VSAPALGAVDGLDNPPYNGLYYLQGSSGPPSPSIQSIIGAPVQPVQPVPRYLPVSAEGKKPMIRDWPNEASSELGDVRRCDPVKTLAFQCVLADIPHTERRCTTLASADPNPRR
jgi:hypothetical protein